MSRLHKETHLVARIGWLRAAVLGANDGMPGPPACSKSERSEYPE